MADLHSVAGCSKWGKLVGPQCRIPRWVCQLPFLGELGCPTSSLKFTMWQHVTKGPSWVDLNVEFQDECPVSSPWWPRLALAVLGSPSSSVNCTVWQDAARVQSWEDLSVEYQDECSSIFTLVTLAVHGFRSSSVKCTMWQDAEKGQSWVDLKRRIPGWVFQHLHCHDLGCPLAVLLVAPVSRGWFGRMSM